MLQLQPGRPLQRLAMVRRPLPSIACPPAWPVSRLLPTRLPAPREAAPPHTHTPRSLLRRCPEPQGCKLLVVGNTSVYASDSAGNGSYVASPYRGCQLLDMTVYLQGSINLGLIKTQGPGVPFVAGALVPARGALCWPPAACRLPLAACHLVPDDRLAGPSPPLRTNPYSINALQYTCLPAHPRVLPLQIQLSAAGRRPLGV